MNKILRVIGILLIVFVMSCEESDPLSFYGGAELLDIVESGWVEFRAGNYIESLDKFQQAKELADEQLDTDTLLIHSTYGNIHAGIGWCNLRLLNAETAKDNFLLSQGYELFSFGTSVGLMATYYELGNGIEYEQSHIDSAIEIGHWIFASGMPEEFENDNSINDEDVRLLLAKSYFAKGILSNGSVNGTDALYWITEISSDYNYLRSDDQDTWSFTSDGSASGEQHYDSFEEIIMMIIIELETQVFVLPA